MTTILGDYRNYPIPEKGTFEWEFKEFKEPQVILDTVVGYSDDEIENQRVIAVSYGFYNYKTGFTKEDIKNGPSRATISSSYQLEKVFVTRIGVDGRQTYPILVGFNNVKLMSQDEINKDSNGILMNYSFIKKGDDSLFERLLNKNSILDQGDNQEKPQTRLYDTSTGEVVYLVKTMERIPKEAVQEVAAIFLSDEVLSIVRKAYGGYLGIIGYDAGIARIMKDSPLKIGEKSSENVRAIKYANKFPITYKSDPEFTMKKFDESPRILAKQKQIVDSRIANYENLKGNSNIGQKNNSVPDDNDGPLP